MGKGGCLSPSSRSLMGSRWDGWDHSCSLCPPSTRIRELPQEEAPRPPHYLSKTHSTSLLTRRYDFISSHPAPTADLPLAYGVGRSSRTPPHTHTPQDPLEPPGPGPPRLRSTASDPTAERDSTRSEVTRSRGPARFPPAPGVLCPPGAAPGAPHAATHLHPEAVTWPADVTARQPGLAAPRAARCPSPKRSEFLTGRCPGGHPGTGRTGPLLLLPPSLSPSSLLRNKKSPHLPATMRSSAGRSAGFLHRDSARRWGSPNPATPPSSSPPPSHPPTAGLGAARVPPALGSGRAAGARGGQGLCGLSQPAGTSRGLFAGGAAGPFCPTAAGEGCSRWGPAGGDGLLGAACGCGGKGEASGPGRAAA